MTRRTLLAQSAAVAAAQTNEPADVRGAKAPPRRNLLTSRWGGTKLLPRERWRPFPQRSDRSAWENLPAEARSSLIGAGQKQLGSEWASLPATAFLEFARTGNRSHYESMRDARRKRLRELVIAECAEGKGRFLDDIGNGIWLTCEETFWGVPAHMGLQRRGNGLPDVTEPVIDLFAAETGAELAWTDYLLGDALDSVHKLVRERVQHEVEHRILAPYRTRNDFWWMGLDADRPVNNWNPWINSNCVACALLMDADEKAREEFVRKLLASLDRFLDAYHDDGGCDEGPSYWGRAGGSLFDNLELLYSACDGKVDFYSIPLVREIGRYIYRAHIHDTWYVNFADAPAKVNIAGDLVWRYGRRIDDANMRALGAWAAKQQIQRPAAAESIGRQLPALFDLKELAAAQGSQPLVRDVWLPGIQVMAARMKSGSAEGLYVAAQAGHNAESHNHNDVGNFVVYAGGEPVLIDVGVETYTAKTFSSRRYDIWTMQSAYHNCPTINGVMQGAGRQFAARAVSYRADDKAAEFTLDIAGAYPAEAGLESWVRTLTLDRRRNLVEIRDRWALRKSGGRIEWSLMTPDEVTRRGGNEIVFGTRAIAVFDANLTAKVETIPIEDARLKSVWGDRVFRVVLASDSPMERGQAVLRIVQL